LSLLPVSSENQKLRSPHINYTKVVLKRKILGDIKLIDVLVFKCPFEVNDLNYMVATNQERSSRVVVYFGADEWERVCVS